MNKVLILLLGIALTFPAKAQNNNFEFGIIVNRGTEGISPQLNLNQIIQSEKTSEAVKKAAIVGIKNTLLPLVKVTNAQQLTNKDNVKALSLRAINTFVLEFKNELTKIKIDKNYQFQIQIAPLISKELKARLSKGEVLQNSLYSTDKFSVFESMPSPDDAYKTARDFMVTDVYNGYIKLVEAQANSVNPFFISLVLDLSLTPDINKSAIMSQVLLGLPTNKTVPFNKSNEQITFHSLKFPTYKREANGLISAYPVAFVNILHRLDQSPVLMNLQFGPLGTVSSEGVWVRPQGIDFKAFVPKLVGVSKKLIEVDFNIFNLNVNLETQQVSDLDLYLSAGIKGMNFKLGTINKTDVDSQFQSEINKTIQEEILKQKTLLKTKVEDTIATNTSIQPDTLELLLKQLFDMAQAGTK